MEFVVVRTSNPSLSTMFQLQNKLLADIRRDTTFKTARIVLAYRDEASGQVAASGEVELTSLLSRLNWLQFPWQPYTVYSRLDLQSKASMTFAGKGLQALQRARALHQAQTQVDGVVNRGPKGVIHR